MRFLLVILVFFILSCKKDETANLDNKSMNFDLALGFHIYDTNGKDLLDPQNSESYNHEEIRIYNDKNLTEDITNEFILNGEGNLVHGPNEKGFMIGIYGRMKHLVSNQLYEESYFLKLSEIDIDTIIVQVTEINNGAYISKFVYNNNVIFDTPQSRSAWNEIIVK
jgi:hypothetical protein